MGNKVITAEKFELSDFRRRKLLHEFHAFYDVNKDGQLQWKDFELARSNICEKSGWKPGTSKWLQAIDLFQDMWRYLQDSADDNVDGTITQEEWVHMWTTIGERYMEERNQKKKKTRDGEEDMDVVEEEVPVWLEKYIRYKFDLYDRAGDGYIDIDEFEYVLSWFDVPAKDCRAAFRILSHGDSKRVDFDYFRSMALEYFRSNDPAAVGNYINGKLDFNDDVTGSM